jgi:tetratricopeptide (TPR) repeat protein
MAEAQNNLGNVFALQDRQDEAIECFRRATGLRAGYAEAHTNLGMALAEQGRFAEAVAALGRAQHPAPGAAETGAAAGPQVARDPALDGVPMLSLDGARRAATADPNLAALAALAEAGSAIPEHCRIALHFALGKAYDARNQPNRAFLHFLEGNMRQRATIFYDEAATLAAMQEVPRDFDAGRMAALRGQGDASAAPIFILGMPRSGIALLEQMLAGHPEMFAAGERADFSRLADAIPGPEIVAPGKLKQLGANYLDSINARLRRRARVIEKMPGNFRHAGLIHLALPNARIIHMRRGAADTCFSCFTKLFRIGHAYSFDLAELGRYDRGFAQVMAHWRGVLPTSVMIDIDYEALVADPRSQIARILDHCALPWSDSCLALGAGQVRQTLHGRSIGRWQRYAAHLTPLLDALQGR